MKVKILFSLFCISLLLSFSSCNSCSNKKSDKKIEENRNSMLIKPEMNVTGDDSAMVIDLVNQYANLLQNKKYEQAMSMIYYLSSNEKLQRPPKALYDKELAAISAFPIYGYQIDYMKFFKETDSEVKCTFYLQDPKKVTKPASMSCMLRPIRSDAKWYLTMADVASEQNRSRFGD